MTSPDIINKPITKIATFLAFTIPLLFNSVVAGIHKEDQNQDKELLSKDYARMCYEEEGHRHYYDAITYCYQATTSSDWETLKPEIKSRPRIHTISAIPLVKKQLR